MQHPQDLVGRSACLFAAIICWAAVPLAAHAQADNYPSRPVRVIVPFPPGGSTDYNARAIQDKFSERLGQQLIVDNRAGASGQIGTGIAMRSDPDGYTLLLHTVAFVTSPILFSKAGYDPVSDFAPVSLISKVPMTISVHPSLPVRSIKELLALARSRPGELNFGSAGIGTNSHITGELFNLLAKSGIVAVHFKGGGPALAATVSGEVHVAFSNVSQTVIMVKANRLRPLAVSGTKRSSTMPDVPTGAEAGLPGFEFEGWHLLVAPRGTPVQIVSVLNERLRATVADPLMLARFEKGGMDPVTTTPQETTAYIKSEQQKWRRVIKERNIKAE